MNIPGAYRLIRQESLKEAAAEAYVLRHEKSGARLILLAADDPNKVFNIIFRTPPSDDTGVPHIIEHTVLCGSDRYPLKDPFIELAKGSLNTFLNAMTFPEKTMYPVASCNDQDFRNLMAVYTDAVFHPNIYKNRMIFEQEGWHYELEQEDSDLTINGVVYNEMKGAFSDPAEVLERENKKLLFPDTPYAFESGGDPDHIPELSYEAFLAFHARYYHPSNSFIYLYGDMDFEERLQWLDEEYLSRYDAIEPDSEIPLQKPFEAMKEAEIALAAAESDDLENTDMYGWSKVVGGLFDPVRCLAFEVLNYALLSSPGAPLRKRLQESGLGADIYGGFESGFREPIFGIFAKDAPKGRYPEFVSVISEELEKACRDGIPKRTLLAGINSIEFSLREGDYGRLPKGLAYCLQISDTWIHDESRAFINMHYDSLFAELKAAVDTDYFKELIRTALIDNKHGVLIHGVPRTGLTEEKDEALKEKLAGMKAALSEEEREKLQKDTAALKAYQSEPQREEDLLKIPLLSVSDIRKEVLPLKNRVSTVSGVPAVFHDEHTSGIAYLDLYFDMSRVPQEDFPYVTLLKNLYAMMDTEQGSYADLNDRISLYTGGLGFTAGTYCLIRGGVREDFGIRTKAVYGRLPELVSLMEEVAFHTDFSDMKRMKDVLTEMRTQMESNMEHGGHQTAMKRVLSYSSVQAYRDELLSGVAFFRFLSDLLEHFDERKEEILLKLQNIREQIFVKEGLTVSVTAEQEAEEKIVSALSGFIGIIPGESFGSGPAPRPFTPDALNEGFKTAAMVQYAAQGGNFLQAGYRYSGSMRVLRTLMSTEYLWNRVRVLGGAYGCMSFYGRDGEMAFVSYRDPNLRETYGVYEAIPDYLQSLSIDSRDMTKYIIGTISDADMPLTPYMSGIRSQTAYRSGITEEDLQKERDEILNCTVEDLRALAPVVRAVLRSGERCTVGGARKLEEAKDLFKTVGTLSGDRAD